MTHQSGGAFEASLLRFQREQFVHDQRCHSDIICLPRTDRLKHYGLHYAKYAGRVARGAANPQPLARTLTDAALVCLSAANTLNQKLAVDVASGASSGSETTGLDYIVDAAGRFADACEKIDHLEEFLPIARAANVDVLRWVLAESTRIEHPLSEAIYQRRRELAERAFYAVDPATLSK